MTASHWARPITRKLVKELVHLRERQIPRLRDFVSPSNSPRDDHASCMISGQKAVREYLAQRTERHGSTLPFRTYPRSIVYHPDVDLRSLFSAAGWTDGDLGELLRSKVECEIFEASETDMKRITGLKRMSQLSDMVCMRVALNGHLAVSNFRDDLEITGEQVPSLCIVHELQDPGNTGTLIRTAYGLGVDGILLSSECASPFGDKALRASRGIVLHEDIRMAVYDDLEELCHILENRGYNVLIAATPVRGVSLVEKSRHYTLGSSDQLALRKPWCLLLTNESHGIADEKIHALQSRHPSIRTMSIPMKHGVDSLNVSSAGAILLSHLAANQ